MFSERQKREISDAVQVALRKTGDPELPDTEIQFSLKVDGAKYWSFAVIRNNGAVRIPSLNIPTEE